MTDLKSIARLACDTVGGRLIPEEERRLTYDESPAHVRAWWDRIVEVVLHGASASEVIALMRAIQGAPFDIGLPWTGCEQPNIRAALLNEKD